MSIIFATYFAGKYNQRAVFIVLLLIPGVIGGCLMAFLPGEAKVGKLVGTFGALPLAGAEIEIDRKLLDKLHRCLPPT